MKNMLLVKRIIVLSLAVLMALSVAACKSSKKKKDVGEEVQTVTYTEDEYMSMKDKADQLDKELAIYDDRYKTLGSFKKKSVIQAGKWSFNKIKDKIVLNGKIVNDSSASIEPVGFESIINIGDNIKVDATNWTVQTGTSRLDFCMPDKAYGQLKIFKYADEDFVVDRIINTWLTPYIEDDNSLEIQSTKELFLDGTKVGEEATAAISILDSTKNGTEFSVPVSDIFELEQIEEFELDPDSNININVNVDNDKKVKAYLRTGLINVNSILLEYQFVYSNTDGKLQIDSLLKNIRVNDNNLYLR